MSGDNKEVKLSLKVLLNKEKNKLLYVVADSQFVDILLSFLTLPLGRIIRILKNHFKDDEIPTIGSLNSLYNSLENLDSDHFVTEAAKETLLSPASSFEDEYKMLRVDFTDSPPAEYFFCNNCEGEDRFRSVSIYYDQCSHCNNCKRVMSKEILVEKNSEAASLGGVFTSEWCFVIFDDLHIFYYEDLLIKITDFLRDTGEGHAVVYVEFGFNEIMELLKASLTSPTPLSDVILKKTTQMNYSTIVESHHTSEDNPNSLKFTLKLIVQKSAKKLLYAQAKEEFVEFGLLIPTGGVGNLLDGKTCFKAINSLYKSATHLLDDEHFETPAMKMRLMKPNLPHGCISKNHIFPLTEKSLPFDYTHNISWFSSEKFPEGQGIYLKRSQNYEVKDDLSVVPACPVSFLASLKEHKIPLSDVEQVELKIGFDEALSILKASLTSTSALSDSLLSLLEI